MKHKKDHKKNKPETDDFFLDLDDVAEDDQVGSASIEINKPAVDEAEDLWTSSDTAEDDQIDDSPLTSDNELIPAAAEAVAMEDDEEWIDDEDKLPIDVYQDKSHIYITAPVPGAEPEDVDVSIDNDMVTIKAKRNWSREINEEDYFYRENFWGSVSRSIILPVSIKENKVEAILKNGVLTVTLPKTMSKPGTSVRELKEKINMLMHNAQLTVTAVSAETITLESELKQQVNIARDLLEAVKIGDKVYLSADVNPLPLASAPEILNELIHGQEAS